MDRGARAWTTATRAVTRRHGGCRASTWTPEGKTTQWRVENSWGKDFGKDGFYIMDDSWFDEFVYQIVVDKKYLTADELAAWATEPVSLRPWDPMGTLALAR